jgi:ribosomal protein S18 acetylase RimI-like enzyme
MMAWQLGFHPEVEAMNPSTNFPAITRAEPEDAEQIAPLFDAYRQFYRQPSDLPGSRRFISDRLRAKQSVVLVAWVTNQGISKAAGFVQLYPSFSSVSMKRLWILNDLYVMPEERKQGVGKTLMESARQLAFSTGAKEIILETAKDNLSAQQLYEQLGYKRDEEFYRYALSV